VVLQSIYEGGLQDHWQDWGWAPRDTELGRPARINFANEAGWVLVHDGVLEGAESVSFSLGALPSFGHFLELRLASDADDTFARVAIGPQHETQNPQGGVWVRVGMEELNPKKLPYNRVILRANRGVDGSWVEIDHYSLNASKGSAAATAHPGGGRHTSIEIDCSRGTRPISPLIYGIAYNPRHNDAAQWRLGATGRRWGGNPASRYNWRLGNAWNAAADWFFANVNYAPKADFTWEEFLQENHQHNVRAALTVPMLGWVARDSRSYSYPVSVFGPQKERYRQNLDMGNGLHENGSKVLGSDPRRTSIPAPPDYVGDWVQAIRRHDEKAHSHSVAMYILDNQPALWSITHRDVHPDPVTYDELLQRTLDFGGAVRKADPGAMIAGPAEWGWPAYFYSAKDAAAGFTNKPDRRMHGDKELLGWYLAQLHAHEERTGKRLLNILDVHYYPQGSGVYGANERNDLATQERRIRSTRSLWDASYRDESWINDRVLLIPRLKSLITQNYPGTVLSIGEYNFGGEKSVSGALAQAEVLGRFGTEGVYSAYYWTYPTEHSSVAQAFAAYRNYDGQGGHFFEHGLGVVADHNMSVFASRDEASGKIVAVVLNFDPRSSVETTVDLVGCGSVKKQRAFQYTGNPEGLMPLDASRLSKEGRSSVRTELPAFSMTVLELSVR
jgi:hypothetical protein